MKRIYLEQGGIKYELGSGIGSWAKSFERAFYPVGTTRVIGDVLMKLGYQYSKTFKYENNWFPVDSKSNTYEEMYKWIAKR